METVQKVLRLYREKYFDFNVRHFTEKVQQEHGITLSYTWIKTALQTAGLVAKSRKRGKHRRKRERRPLPGMMLHVDGSEHGWLGGGVRQDLIAILDDASNEVAQEGTAFVTYRGTELDKIFSHQAERVVGQDNTIVYGRLRLQIQRQEFRFSMARCRCLVCEHLDGTISVYYGPHLLGRYNPQGEALLATRRRSKGRAA